MPDIIGRQNLLEMRGRVWQLLDSLRPFEVDQTTGAAIGPYDINPLYPREEVDREINSSLAAHSTDMMLNGTRIFADEQPIDIVRDIVEYPLPTDMMFLRSLWWKPPDILYTLVPPVDRIYMWEFDEDNPIPEELLNGAPTYRRNLNFIVLNETPTQDNPAGVLARYIKWVNALSRDEDRIETEFAQLLQECVVIDSAINLLASKNQMEPPTMWVDRRTQWQNRLALAVRNATMPPFVNMMSRQPLLHRRRKGMVRR